MIQRSLMANPTCINIPIASCDTEYRRALNCPEFSEHSSFWQPFREEPCHENKLLSCTNQIIALLDKEICLANMHTGCMYLNLANCASKQRSQLTSEAESMLLAFK